MPYNQFICPDGIKCDIKDCLHKCRIHWAFDAERCLSLPTLRAIAEQREWKGLPSTTMLLNGTRESYLRITTTFAVKPQDMIWAIHGTKVHSRLENCAGDDTKSEERLYDEYSSGSFDYFEPEPGFLYDYKTYGSYKTAKTLGLYKEKIPIMGADGKQEKYKNGKLKYYDKWRVGHKSRLDVATQLNDYRMKLEKKGFKVNKMFVEALTRDAGTYMAQARGINENAQLILINKISDSWVEAYMKAKSQALLKALKTKTLPSPCKKRETWGGIKCERFCNVWEFCDVGKKVHQTISQK